MNILHIDSSINKDQSVSKKLGAELVNRIKSEKANAEVTYYDLDAAPVPHFSSKDLEGTTREEALSGTNVLDDFLNADTLVIGAPLYNFAIPSQLKAWLDRICVSGKTFRYTENGPEGLAGDKRAFIISSRGGVYGDDSPLEHQESYLKTVLNFVGITDIEIIRAEGVNISAEKAEEAKSYASEKIKSVTL